MIRLRNLRIAARPFVTRTVRGARGRRIAALGLLLTALSGVMGGWIAHGDGGFEHELRVALELEPNRYTREREEFTIFAEDEDEAARMRRELGRLSRTGLAGPTDDFSFDGRLPHMLRRAVMIVHSAADSTAPTSLQPLQAKAKVWMARHDQGHPADQDTYFAWGDPRDVRELRSILARDGVPEVTVYASPLGTVDALRLSGLFAGGALMLLLLLCAPVIAGTQMAQETHENTLQPLAGSALSAPELALGLTCGPAALVGLLAAPQLVLLLATATALGSLGAALAFVAIALCGGAFLVMLAQLAGLAMGRVRSPGLVGGGLAAALGLLGGAGIALASELVPRTAGVLALLPQAAASHALAQSFDLGAGGPGFGAAVDTTLPVAVGALGMLALAGLGLRALARRIGHTAPSALQAGEALLGAGVAMALITLANPYTGSTWRAEEFYLLNLGLLSVPFVILLMMRTPTGDLPPALRRTPVRRLVLEFVGWSALYLGLAAALVGPEKIGVFASPVAALYLAWFLGVAALLALRLVVAPLTFASRLYVGVIAVFVAMAFGQTAMWARAGGEFGLRTPPLFIFSEASPFLGALQAALTLVIPWTLLRAIRRPGRAAPAGQD